MMRWVAPRWRSVQPARQGPSARWEASALTQRAPLAHRLRQREQQGARLVPADAGIGDALAVAQRAAVGVAGLEGLRAGHEMALDHRAENLPASRSHLARHVAHHISLA